MSRTVSFVVLAGIASGTASAQSTSLDIDRAYAAELRADASRHASLLQAGGSGYDVAFHVGDAWSNNRLNINGHLATRWLGNYTDADDSDLVSKSFTHGFEQQYATLSFNGNVVNPQMKFKVELELGQADRDETFSNILRDAWAQYDFVGEVDGFYVRWGQFKVPVLNEENIHNGKQLAVARGPVNEFFTPSWSEGVMLGYRAESYAVHTAVTDGIRGPIPALPTTAGTAYSGADADFALSVRADVKFAGAWEQFDDFTSFRSSDTAIKVGAGFHFQTGSSTGGPTGGATADADYYLWTVDAQWEGDGWNLAAGYIGHSIDIGTADAETHGVYLQGGMFVSDQWEIFGRYDYLNFDSDFISAAAGDSYSFLTLGANHYFVPQSHAVKLTGDVIFAFDDSTDVGPASVLNLGDTGLLFDTEGEVTFRLQVSVLF
ncbi:MAG: hypothetical protein RIB60_06645 [Phycisphaerales bacterium]